MNWDLKKHFYNSIEDINLMNDFNSDMIEFDNFIKKYENILSNSEDIYLNYLIEYDRLGEKANKVFRYLYLLSDINVDNTDIKSLESKLSKIYSGYSERFLFVDEANKKIGPDKLLEWSKLDKFKDFKKVLFDTSTNLKYSLTEKEELVCIKLGQANSNSIFGDFSNTLEFNIDGEDLTQEEIRSMRLSPDEETRKKACFEIAKVFNNKGSKVVFGNLYSNVCKKNISSMELRGYDNVLSRRNISEDVSDSSVTNLLNNVSNNYNLYHRFLKIKAKFLGKEKLNTWDILAPINLEAKSNDVSFEEGFNFYLETIKDIDPILYDYSKDMLSDGRLDVLTHKNKCGGAYAFYDKNFKSFSLLNWTNSLDDVTTLAHELGHCFHGYLSQKQNSYNFSTPMVSAETASIFNETIMFGSLLSKSDEQSRTKLIFDRLDDIFSTTFRQVAYVLFERRCHQSYKDNEPLTWKDYDEYWFDEMSKLYGDSVILDKDLIKFGWSSIPHIFNTPFYCYAYSFGNITALNIYQNYHNSNNKEDFMVKYHNLLSSGGVDTPESLLQQNFGFDYNSDNFFNVAFEHINELIEKLEK